ncbi:hypothetical protein O6H91_Y569000 [Diphasiastrum complanatum]|nr:hypothetical protein O6H91_Y569000 [Diphasiastrum complanatum]
MASQEVLVDYFAAERHYSAWDLLNVNKASIILKGSYIHLTKVAYNEPYNILVALVPLPCKCLSSKVSQGQQKSQKCSNMIGLFSGQMHINSYLRFQKRCMLA